MEWRTAGPPCAMWTAMRQYGHIKGASFTKGATGAHREGGQPGRSLELYLHASFHGPDRDVELLESIRRVVLHKRTAGFHERE